MKAQRRVVTYIALFIGLFIGYLLLREVTWQGSKQLHTLMEVVASLLAFTVGAMALVRFYSQKNNTFLFIGAGFLGTGLLDGYHAVVTSTFFDIYFPSPPPSLIPWSWVASRWFLSFSLWLSWWFWQRENRLGDAGRISEKAVYFGTSVLTLASFGFFAFVPLPPAYYPDWFFHRPEEFIPAGFFLLALIGYLNKGHWKEDNFEHWLILSIIVGFMGQAMFMSFSGYLFDMMFDAAHLLKKVSYICVLIGLLVSMYTSFKQSEQLLQSISNTETQLRQRIEENKRTEVQLREHIEADKRAADEALRITCALDSATTNILITDAHYKIIYLNETAQCLFKKEEDKIRQDLPHFDANNLIGAHFDSFHKNPAQHRQLLAQLTRSHHARITVGGLTLDHIITPVINVRGEHLGVVIEFNNRTFEIATEQEINQVIHAASKGDFQQRIHLEDKTGFFKMFSEGLNQIMDFNQCATLDIMHITAAIAKGNLTQQIENNYVGMFEQLKTDINTMVQKLTDIMIAILQTVEMVNRAAEEISQGNLSLSQRVEEQASSLEETAASMEQMTATVQQNADSAKQAAQLATNAKESAEKGGEVVRTAILAITEISRSSKQITDIIGVIDEIAFQTNLLALNAAVEAARAGEQGRGFAVVASEVRDLAQRSAAAAKEIKRLIGDSVVKVEEGTKLANNSGESLKEIVSAVKKVSNIITDIATASQEQYLGIQQVNQAITKMDETTQQNAALVEEATSASSVMKEQTLHLKEQVAFFNVGKLE
jgi:methyl-accepting chemotaxis protein